MDVGWSQTWFSLSCVVMDPTHAHDITRYGAVGDGVTLNTKAIQTALDAVGPGGIVLVPPGTFLTGTIFLRSNTVLELMPGATLLGSPRLEDYIRVSTGIVGDRTGYHLVVAENVHNIVIRGQGTIDGNGPSFWEPTGGSRLEEYPLRAPDPETGRLMWILAPRQHDGRPSPMVELRHSQDVRVEGVHLTNAGGWTLHLFDCDRGWVRGIRLTSNLMGPNNDGIDITECRDVMISDCDISCCDDAICLKTYPGGRACERITATNCVIRTRCVAFKTGEAYGHFRQVTFSNSVIYECSRAVGLYAMNGGLVEDVVISNIVCDTRGPLMVNRPIHIEASRIGHRQPCADPMPPAVTPPRAASAM
jgi:polygalacturonase